ncbi:hypothetical protein Aasi_1333 [Candidatus Amoebophilus asiaticus 5a2]|uniref:Uncharacterized protein n=1 Tax=Amoebophilus asiaticus (strain 5a2) TaxID=452471 RepID=B3ETU1_AMOA5|nr:hypothetical protein [Candidatus Amoebophilus asiaticus]ACE06643.1 hypothetical protein Aasi_1333 [Candidatus Amoebophilus asiaticus 5a2]
MVALKGTAKAEIAGTWSISIDPVKGIQEHIDLASAPAVDVIRGDVKKPIRLSLLPLH